MYDIMERIFFFKKKLILAQMSASSKCSKIGNKMSKMEISHTHFDHSQNENKSKWPNHPSKRSLKQIKKKNSFKKP